MTSNEDSVVFGGCSKARFPITGIHPILLLSHVVRAGLATVLSCFTELLALWPFTASQPSRMYNCTTELLALWLDRRQLGHTFPSSLETTFGVLMNSCPFFSSVATTRGDRSASLDGWTRWRYLSCTFGYFFWEGGGWGASFALV